jgi:hypothetical protein
MSETTLASWRDGPVMQAIIDFVARATTPGPDFVAVADRIATFDNDGTLWVEQPLPPQFDFVFRKWGEEIAADPTLAEQQPFKSIVEKDMTYFAGVATQDPDTVRTLLAAFARTWQGTTPDEFDAQVREWLTTVKQPKLGVPYIELVYQPMPPASRCSSAPDHVPRRPPSSAARGDDPDGLAITQLLDPACGCVLGILDGPDHAVAVCEQLTSERLGVADEVSVVGHDSHRASRRGQESDPTGLPGSAARGVGGCHRSLRRGRPSKVTAKVSRADCWRIVGRGASAGERWARARGSYGVGVSSGAFGRVPGRPKRFPIAASPKRVSVVIRPAAMVKTMSPFNRDPRPLRSGR